MGLDPKAVQLDGNSLSLESFHQIVSEFAPVALSEAAKTRMLKSRAVVEKAAEGDEKIYSINTGFGILSKVKIQKDSLLQLQRNIVRSHCAGVGEPLAEKESRAMLVLRTNVLAKGYSGVRPDVAELLVNMLNKRVHPLIPSKGSVGASGDLAPLAHMASVLIGEGHATFQGMRMLGGEALKKAGLTPLTLEPKEGLALINGTQQMTAMGALLLKQAEELADIADWISQASLEGVLGSPGPFTDWIHETRPYQGQIASAKNMIFFSQKSEIRQSHVDCDRVQDPYSFRCIAQVHGACRELLGFVRHMLSVELNAATDNPLIHPETGQILSNGNFHGQPIAFALDILAMAVHELGSLSERRTAKLIDPNFSSLPSFLIKNEGLNSGLMMAQVTAASLVAENRIFTHPASTDSIPTNNDKEDHVSMGPNAARKAKGILENLYYILAIEAMSAVQALEFRKPLKGGIGAEALYDLVRKNVAPLEEDRYLHTDIEKLADMIRQGDFYEKLQEVTGCLKPATPTSPSLSL